MNKKVINLLLLLLLIIPIISGCGNREFTKNESAKADTYDNYGDKVAINYVPEHVITMGPNATELFCALGLNKKVIGDCLNNHSRGALPKYKKQYDSIKELTHGAPTKEAVLGSNTDFIYGIDFAFGDEGVDKNDLDNAKIPTYINKAKTINQEYNEIEDLGKIFKVQKKANSLINNQKKRIQNIEDKIKGMKPVKVLVYDSGDNGIFTATGANFETTLIEKAGGENIFSNIKNKAWTTVSTEEAVKRNPDVIIVHDYDKPSVEKKIADIKKDPALSKTSAVKNNKFVSIPLEGVLPGPRMAYTIETFASAFHPNKVQITPEEENEVGGKIE